MRSAKNIGQLFMISGDLLAIITTLSTVAPTICISYMLMIYVTCTHDFFECIYRCWKSKRFRWRKSDVSAHAIDVRAHATDVRAHATDVRAHVSSPCPCPYRQICERFLNTLTLPGDNSVCSNTALCCIE